MRSWKMAAPILVPTILVLLSASAQGPCRHLGGRKPRAVRIKEESSFDFDDSTTGHKVFGGFTFLKFLGMEGSYVDLGKPEDSVGGGGEAEIKLTAWDAFALARLPLGKRFEVFGKAGLG